MCSFFLIQYSPQLVKSFLNFCVILLEYLRIRWNTSYHFYELNVLKIHIQANVLCSCHL